MLNRTQPVGGLLREWRQRQRLSQLDLAPDGRIKIADAAPAPMK